MAQRSYGKDASYKSFVLIFSALVFGCHEQIVIGQLTLSPMAVAPVCRVGDPLQLICNATVATIEWSFTVVNQHGRDERVTGFIRAGSLSNQSELITVNSTTFTWIRNSSQPLIVTLSIDSVGIGLNGTVVNCVDSGVSMSVASTTIQIIDTSNDHYPPTLRIVSVEYSADNVTVTVEWTQQLYVTYNVTVVPLVPIVFTGSTSRQLTIPYNMDYNLSVEAIAPCRPSTTANIILKYVNCGDPELPSAASNDSVPDIEADIDGLPIEGNTVRFSCRSGLELIGEPSSNSATCTGSGEWDPDPRDFMCTNDTPICSYPFSGTDNGSAILLIGYLDPATEGATITFECPREHILIGPSTSTCMGNGEWEPDPREVECREIQKPPMEESVCLQMGVPVYIIAVVSSFSVVVILVLSVTFFIVGFACGHYHGKGKCYCSSQTDNPHNVPVYEDVLCVPRVRNEAHQKQGFKLRENVAYLSSKSMITELNQ